MPIRLSDKILVPGGLIETLANKSACQPALDFYAALPATTTVRQCIDAVHAKADTEATSWLRWGIKHLRKPLADRTYLYMCLRLLEMNPHPTTAARIARRVRRIEADTPLKAKLEPLLSKASRSHKAALRETWGDV